MGPEVTKIGQELWCEDTITETLDGFIIIADSDGTILCVTESVCLYLGLSQVCISLWLLAYGFLLVSFDITD